MLKTSKNFRRERSRSNQRAKFWRKLGRVTLRLLLILAPLLTKLVELVLVVVRRLRE